MVTVDLNTENDEVSELPTRDAETLGGIPASEYALKENIPSLEPYALKIDTAPDSVLLGGKAPQYYIQPRNLLDNSDFSNLVAQAGLPGMHGGAIYLADRWALTHNNVTVTKNNGYCSITRDSTYKTSLAQRIPGNFAGNTLTIAAKIRCVDKVFLGFYRHDWTKIDNKSFVGSDGIVCYSITLPEDTTDVAIRVYLAYDDPSASVDIYWMALYEGEYTAETLPPYVPKGYTVEMEECYRYYYKAENNAAMFYPATYIGTNNIYSVISMPQKMVKLVPSINAVSINMVSLPYAIQTGFSFTCVFDGGNQLRLCATKTGHGLTSAMFEVNQLEISADL